MIRALSAEVQLLDAALLLADDAIDPLNEPHGGDRPGPALHVALRSSTPSGCATGPLDRTITGFRRLQVLYPSANITAANDIGAADRHAADPRGAIGHAGTAASSLVTVVALGPALVAVGDPGR